MAHCDPQVTANSVALAHCLCGRGFRTAGTDGCVAAQVRFWDVTQGQQVLRLTGHTDYVRAGAVSPLDTNVWATGLVCRQLLLCCDQPWVACACHNAVCLMQNMPFAGGYDHMCKVWDVRSKTATLSLDHGAPVEALTYFPSGVRLPAHVHVMHGCCHAAFLCISLCCCVHAQPLLAALSRPFQKQHMAEQVSPA